MDPASPDSASPFTMTSSVGAPAGSTWRKYALTRAKELESLSNWAYRAQRTENTEELAKAIQQHLAATKDAVAQKGLFGLWRHHDHSDDAVGGGVAVLGLVAPTAIPLCFQTEQGGQAVVVCPTAQSPLGSSGQRSGTAAPDVDDVVARTAGRTDLLVIELVGFIAVALAAAATIRGIRGSSDVYGLSVALALLKLPTGAITVFLGVPLMSGEFFPGLTLDTSAQIFAWAIVFGVRAA